MFDSMLNRKRVLGRGFLWGGLALDFLAGASPGRPEALYKLDTTCSMNGASAVPCTVEAIQEGTSTPYRHRIGAATETIRITDSPVHMSRWIAATKEWQSLQQAGARFSINTV
jgi:hypothetical protein